MKRAAQLLVWIGLGTGALLQGMPAGNANQQAMPVQRAATIEMPEGKHLNFSWKRNIYLNSISVPHSLPTSWQIGCLQTRQAIEATAQSRRLLNQCFPHQKRAIAKGFKLIQVLAQQKPGANDKRVRPFLGTLTAFYTFGNPPTMTISSTNPEDTPITLIVDFKPRLSTQPIITASCILCTIKAIDMKKRIIHAEASPQDWILISTG